MTQDQHLSFKVFKIRKDPHLAALGDPRNPLSPFQVITMPSDKYLHISHLPSEFVQSFIKSSKFLTTGSLEFINAKEGLNSGSDLNEDKALVD